MVIVILLICMTACKSKDSKEQIEIESITENGFYDNSTDLYTGTFYKSIKMEAPKKGNVEHTSDRVSLGKEKIFFYETYHDLKEDEWYRKFEIYSPSEKEKSDIYIDDCRFGAFSITKTDKYFIDIRPNMESRGIEFYDENNELVETVMLDFIPDYEPSVGVSWSMKVDKDGLIHILQSDEDFTHSYYFVATKDRKIKYSEVFDNEFSIGSLHTMPDGRVVLSQSEKHIKSITNSELMVWYYYINPDTGEKTEVFKQNINDGRNIEDFDFTLDGRILYANKEGLYFCDKDFQNDVLVYKWTNHGMTSDGLTCLSSDGEKIKLLVHNKSIDSYDYYILEPTKAKRDIVEIEMAVAPQNKEMIKKAIADFNRSHPTCIITIKDDYDKTVLLTKLIARDGPVLIDTDLTGFATQKKLWMNLEKIFDEEGFNAELNEPALNLGKIGGEEYGVVTDFKISTIVAPKETEGWCYDDFVAYASNPELKGIFFEKYNSYINVIDFFGTKEENSYFIKEGKPVFLDKEFDNLIDLLGRFSKNYAFLDSTNDFDNILCRRLLLESPEQLYVYSQRNGKDLAFVGYPSYNGAKNRLVAGSRIAIRNSASKEEKEVATAFVKQLLSYESQKKMSEELGFSLSVRKDVLDEQIAGVKKGKVAIMSGTDEDVLIDEEVDAEKIREELINILKNAEPYENEETGYEEIIVEEFTNFFDGVITKEMLADHLNSRINIYLAERNN